LLLEREPAVLGDGNEVDLSGEEEEEDADGGEEGRKSGLMILFSEDCPFDLPCRKDMVSRLQRCEMMTKEGRVVNNNNDDKRTQKQP
jgi:hypothetical protein